MHRASHKFALFNASGPQPDNEDASGDVLMIYGSLSASKFVTTFHDRQESGV